MSISEGFSGFQLLSSSEMQTPRRTLSQYYISDIMLQEYKQCSADNFLNIPIRRIQVYQKQLDQDLPWYKTMVATLSGIPLYHSFIYVQADNNVFITIDFYKQNRVAQRLAKTKQEVLFCQTSDKRSKAKVSSNSMFKMTSFSVDACINVGDLRKIKEQAVSHDEYNEFNNNCSNYCQRFMEIVQKRYINP